MVRSAQKSVSVRRPPRGRAGARGRSSRDFPWVRVVAGVLFLLAILVTWAAVARRIAPRSNTARSQFDAIVVLGTPADSDGNPTPEMLDRVTESVNEYRRGVAPRLIVTGAAAHNRYVEAELMARVAEAQGVPASAVFEEPRATDTIQNVCYSDRIMKAHGWHAAEVVSSAAHLPRAAMILARLAGDGGLQWRVHAAPANLTPGAENDLAPLAEVLKTVRYLVWARWVDGCDG